MTESSTPPPSAPAAGPATGDGRCRSGDGIELHWRSWVPASPVGVIVIVHGLAEHGGRYAETAQYFAEHGWAVYAGDLRAHGHSADVPGAGRVHVNRFSDYQMDVTAFLTLARQSHRGLPLFLLGHSMGGLIVISHVLQNPGAQAGAVISSPALGTHPDFKPPALLRLLVGILDRIAPRLRFRSDLDTSAISRDPSVVQAYLDDPLVSQTVSARWYAEILRAIDRAHADAHTLQVPLLLMQSGSDRLVDPSAPERWAASTTAGLVERVNWEGLYHEMFNEPEKPRVRQRALDWLQKQTARTQAP